MRRSFLKIGKTCYPYKKTEGKRVVVDKECESMKQIEKNREEER